MARQRPAHLNFISNFVDSATVGTFFEDLRRIKREGNTLRAMPRIRQVEEIRFEDTAAAAA